MSYVVAAYAIVIAALAAYGVQRWREVARLRRALAEPEPQIAIDKQRLREV